MVNERGELIGVLASRDGAGQELVYGATPDGISRFLQRARPLYEPGSASAWHAGAILFDRLSRPKTAIEAHAKAVSIAPTNGLMVASYATSLAANEQFIEAMTQAQNAMKLSGRSAEANASLAEAFIELGELDHANELANAALKENPKLTKALVARGSAITDDKAMVDADAALTIDPQCFKALCLRASPCKRNDPNDREKALTDWSRAIGLRPWVPSPRSARPASI